MKTKLTILLCVLLVQSGFSQNKLPYQLFDKKGKKTTYDQLLKAAEKSEVVLFGEYHDNAIDHWLELALAKDLAKKKAVVLGAEMFEADNQIQLNQYLKGEINQKQLDSMARLWPNYKTDYKPIVDFAKEQNITFVAANVPRRYANLVYKQGYESLENLSPQEKSWIAPLPIVYDSSLKGYQEMLKMGGEHANENMPKAQNLKDATMAYFILKNKKANSVFIHYNGTYHSDNFEGIYWHLKHAEPELKIITIATVTQSDLSKLDKEQYGKADFILVIDADVTRTY